MEVRTSSWEDINLFIGLTDVPTGLGGRSTGLLGRTGSGAGNKLVPRADGHTDYRAQGRINLIWGGDKPV